MHIWEREQDHMENWEQGVENLYVPVFPVWTCPRTKPMSKIKGREVGSQKKQKFDVKDCYSYISFLFQEWKLFTPECGLYGNTIAHNVLTYSKRVLPGKK